MKLTHFERQEGYFSVLTFENGEVVGSDLSGLVGEHVEPTELETARIDPEWGCLEFKGGHVDVAPKTLYRWAHPARQSTA